MQWRSNYVSVSTVTIISCLVSDGKISFMITVELRNYVWKSIFLNSVTVQVIFVWSEKQEMANDLCFHPYEQDYVFFLFTCPCYSVVMKILNVLSFICRCCQCNQSGAETAQLLSKLEYEEIVSILSCKEFNSLNLKDCLKLGIQLTLQVTFL
jgi:hypothetical protein